MSVVDWSQDMERGAWRFIRLMLGIWAIHPTLAAVGLASSHIDVREHAEYVARQVARGEGEVSASVPSTACSDAST